MKKTNFYLFFILTAIIFSCNKGKEEMTDLEKLRNNTNQKSYTKVQLDSAQAIKAITLQKIQEVMDLSTLYNSGNKNTEIDTTIYSQMKSYFYKPDSLTFKNLLDDLDSLKVKTAKVNSLNVYKMVYKKDTLDYADFKVEYFDKNKKSLGNYDKTAQYILKKAPIKFKKEFKFYFISFYTTPLKDSTSVGVTR